MTKPGGSWQSRWTATAAHVRALVRAEDQPKSLAMAVAVAAVRVRLCEPTSHR